MPKYAALVFFVALISPMSARADSFAGFNFDNLPVYDLEANETVYPETLAYPEVTFGGGIVQPAMNGAGNVYETSDFFPGFGTPDSSELGSQLSIAIAPSFQVDEIRFDVSGYSNFGAPVEVDIQDTSGNYFPSLPYLSGDTTIDFVGADIGDVTIFTEAPMFGLTLDNVELNPNVATTPEPSSLILLGTGLAAAFAMGVRRLRSPS